MQYGYEINDLAKEESWRMFRIIGEFVEGFDKLSGIEPVVCINHFATDTDEELALVRKKATAAGARGALAGQDRGGRRHHRQDRWNRKRGQQQRSS